MLAAGDFEEFQVLLDYEKNQWVFLTQRTEAYWGHPGMWTTETTHLSGAYDMSVWVAPPPPPFGCVPAKKSAHLHVSQPPPPPPKK